jgi:hypothetical protein
METADHYLDVTLSGSDKKQLRRRSKQLAALGRLDYVELDGGGDIGAWTESFLNLEASGWKGRERSAMACSPANRAFFCDITMGAFHKRRLLAPALVLNDSPIAQHCVFLAGAGAFAFKTSFDERYSRYSPGFHLRCEMIRHLHDNPAIRWMDSCTGPDNQICNRLYPHRRTILTLLVPLRRGVKGLIASGLPFFRTVKRLAGGFRASTPSEDGNIG